MPARPRAPTPTATPTARTKTFSTPIPPPGPVNPASNARRNSATASRPIAIHAMRDGKTPNGHRHSVQDLPRLAHSALRRPLPASQTVAPLLSQCSGTPAKRNRLPRKQSLWHIGRQATAQSSGAVAHATGASTSGTKYSLCHLATQQPRKTSCGIRNVDAGNRQIAD